LVQGLLLGLAEFVSARLWAAGVPTIPGTCNLEPSTQT